MTRFLYIVRCNEFYKIGISDNVKNRMFGMQTDNPYKLELIVSVQGPCDAISRFEKRLHKSLKKWNIQGEWFALTENELTILTEQCTTFEKFFRHDSHDK